MCIHGFGNIAINIVIAWNRENRHFSNHPIQGSPELVDELTVLRRLSTLSHVTSQEDKIRKTLALNSEIDVFKKLLEESSLSVVVFADMEVRKVEPANGSGAHRVILRQPAPMHLS